MSSEARPLDVPLRRYLAIAPLTALILAVILVALWRDVWLGILAFALACVAALPMYGVIALLNHAGLRHLVPALLGAGALLGVACGWIVMPPLTYSFFVGPVFTVPIALCVVAVGLWLNWLVANRSHEARPAR